MEEVILVLVRLFLVEFSVYLKNIKGAWFNEHTESQTEHHPLSGNS